MKSLKSLYKIGRGPSSSHTMGPSKASVRFAAKHPDAASFEVTLYGSLAATGKGHLTDVAVIEGIRSVTSPDCPVEILWHPEIILPYHPNGMKFISRDSEGKQTDEWIVYSVGGGSISEGEGSVSDEGPDIYELTHITDIKEWCQQNGTGYWEYVDRCEDSDIWDYLNEIWKAMQECILKGLDTDGALPGPLHIARKASTYYVRANGYKPNLQSRGLVFAYALATSEENASGGTVVTAPTCGSCGVLPAVLYHLHKAHDFSDKRILAALATGGLFGNVVKENASISGADVGCQGEVGVACAMASAAATALFGGTPAQIEYAAEMGLEHHLGMTCDPICGMVQIPCIERNAFAAARAFDADIYATFSDGLHRVPFDGVVEVMKRTGHDLPSLYKETSTGGLAAGYTWKMEQMKKESKHR